MLIDFSISNFRSFYHKKTLSLSPRGKLRVRKIIPFETDYSSTTVLPAIAIYGPNNAGKSNFLRALKALNWLVTNSGKFNSDDEIKANEFFRLNKQTLNKPTLFEIDFIAQNSKRYKYLVEFDKNRIFREELSFVNISPTQKETINTLYKRNKQEVNFVSLKGAKESITFNKNQLFLSRGDIEGNEELKQVYSFFSKELRVLHLTETENTDFLTRGFAKYIVDTEDEDENLVSLIEGILKESNTGILNIHTEVSDLSKYQFSDDTPQTIKDKIFEVLKYELQTTHRFFDGEEEVGITRLPMNLQSTGTRKLVGLLPLILIALKRGQVLSIDEINTSLHSELTSWIVDLFNNPKTNPKKAQLIITTHDITLLNRELYDRDGIYVIEKNELGASDLYSFGDFTGIRESDRLTDFYESGRLGGVARIPVPYLEHLIQKFMDNE